MTPSEIFSDIIDFLPYSPNPLQEQLIAALAAYVSGHGPNDIFILNGYAGTGKTSIIGALIKALEKKKVKTITLAPTGRAAKVAASFSGGKALTIHKRVFRAESPDPSTGFVDAPNYDRNTLFIADEASLIADNPAMNNSLLTRLLRHIFSSTYGNMLILVGDIAQLPPVGMTSTSAMSAERIGSLGFNPIKFSLDLPMRHTEGSGILFNATQMRHWMNTDLRGNLPYLSTSGFDDVEVISSAELADKLSDSWNRVGIDNSIIITRSNSRANKYNQAIRNMIMMAEEPLQRSDRLVISKNDYYWSKINKFKSFIANGDMAEVAWVGKTEKMYGRYFTDCELYFPSSEMRIATKIMLRSLMAEGSAIPRDEMDRFFTHVMVAKEGEVSERIQATLDDPYYNALQAKYGYCITCHKAQGGQWDEVYIDMSGIDTSSIEETFFRWIYTAITRAVRKVYFINPTLPVA